MKFIRFTLIGLMATGSLMGEPPRRDRGGPLGGEGPRGGRDFGRFFDSADTNGDGVVSSGEFADLERISKLPVEKRDELFKRFDKNGDGSIQNHEMRPPKDPPGGGRPIPRLHELDTNKDGKVSFNEFLAGPFAKRLPPERMESFFKRLDTNKDGHLSPDDRPKGRGGSREGHRPPQYDRRNMIDSLDQNGDKALSFEEFRQAPWLRDKNEDEQEKQFEEIDKNDDLIIDKSDMPSGGPEGFRRNGPRPGGPRPGGPRPGGPGKAGRNP